MIQQQQAMLWYERLAHLADSQLGQHGPVTQHGQFDFVIQSTLVRVVVCIM
jgi:hypothetical protein